MKIGPWRSGPLQRGVVRYLDLRDRTGLITFQYRSEKIVGTNYVGPRLGCRGRILPLGENRNPYLMSRWGKKHGVQKQGRETKQLMVRERGK